MNWTKVTRRCKANDLRAIGLILLWVVLYFNIYRFTAVRAVAEKVPVVWKLASFFALLLGSLYVANQGYRAILTQTPRKHAGVIFSTVFISSMIFASVCSDQYVLFMVLSVSIYGFDRLLYYLAYRKAFRRKNINVTPSVRRVE
jgi:hypothetical protein